MGVRDLGHMDRLRGVAVQELRVVLPVRREAADAVASPVALGEVSADAVRPGAALRLPELPTIRGVPSRAGRGGPRRRGERPPAVPDAAVEDSGQARPARGYPLRDGRDRPGLGPPDLVPPGGRQVLRAVRLGVRHRQALRPPRRQAGAPRAPAPRALLATGVAPEGAGPAGAGSPAGQADGPGRRRRRRRRRHRQGRQVDRRRARRPRGLARGRLREERRRARRPRGARLAGTRRRLSRRLRLKHGRVHGSRRLHRHQGGTGDHRRGRHPRPPDPPLLLPPRPGGRQRQVRHEAAQVRHVQTETQENRRHRPRLVRRRREPPADGRPRRQGRKTPRHHRHRPRHRQHHQPTQAPPHPRSRLIPLLRSCAATR
mmetsp:Transcript_8413/g.26181  ORF Transcript_8413/g.26181 Transcript_8413/m.26181 type:complete len:373 (+) Transcript_8413:449-1567(+)